MSQRFSRLIIMAVGAVCLAASLWWVFQVSTSPVFAITFNYPTPTRIEAVEGYHIITYVEGSTPYPDAPGSLSFTASLLDYVKHRLGILEWVVWEPVEP